MPATPLAASPRSFLILQGLATPFLFKLARHLRSLGHATAKIHLCGADLLFWPGPAILFRGRLADWPIFLARQLSRLGVTDLILFGDCRPHHLMAIEIARDTGVTVHVLEEGYLRPGFITVEHGGSNGYSALPRDPAVLRALAAGLPAPVSSVPAFPSFARRAAWDILAQDLGLALVAVFPHYRWHGLYHPLLEYAGWMRRFLRAPVARRANRAAVDRLMHGSQPFFLMPMQLDSDYQMRVHSPFASVLEAVEATIVSFVRAAPAGTLLVFKTHPLDPGLIDFPRRIAEIGRRHGIADRLRVVGEADLPGLIDRSSGVVLVNSTTGILALRLGHRVKALGDAIFDMPGLTFQGPLDAFWSADAHPDSATVDAFLKVMVARTQVEGDYFTPVGIAVGVLATAQRFLAGPPS